jgi:hypothetical protein
MRRAQYKQRIGPFKDSLTFAKGNSQAAPHFWSSLHDGGAMTKTSMPVVLMLLLLMLPSARAAPSAYWHVNGGLAYSTMDLPDAKIPGTTVTLTIEYALVGDTCVITVGVALLEGAKYGTPVRHGRVSDLMTISVGGRTWRDRPMVVQYNNGFEAGIRVSSELISALRTGNSVRVQQIADSPTFEFSLDGADSVIGRASGMCARR